MRSLSTPVNIAAVASLTAALALAGCQAPGSELPGVVAGGKGDNFFSLTAKEFIVEGRTTVTLEPELANAEPAIVEERVRELVGLKQIAIAWFLTQYLIEKKHDASNPDFGGMGGLARGGAFEDLDIQAVDDLTYEFTFRQIIAAKPEFIRSLDTEIGEDGRPTFELEIGKPSNDEMARLETNHEWYRQSPWSAWNPESVPAENKELLVLAVEEEVESVDAWFDHQRLVEDGVLSIDVHFGWDYHDAYHLRHARALFEHLVDQGFTAPVASFDELGRDSGPLLRTSIIGEQSIEVQVRIFVGVDGSETDPNTDEGGILLEDDLRASLATRDVIMYSGHSGPFYGFAMGNWKVTAEGDFDDSEMAGAEMPADRYQIVFAEGCDTYQIGEAFRQNPAKPDLNNLDVITTTQASNASTPAAVFDFISHLMQSDPPTIKELLQDLDHNSPWFETMYGIHGIDDNPQLHPLAEPSTLCQSCSSEDDCGDVHGNTCADLGDGGSCVAFCTADSGCPAGYQCLPLDTPSVTRTGVESFESVCVPTGLTCQ